MAKQLRQALVQASVIPSIDTVDCVRTLDLGPWSNLQSISCNIMIVVRTWTWTGSPFVLARFLSQTTFESAPALSISCREFHSIFNGAHHHLLLSSTLTPYFRIFKPTPPFAPTFPNQSHYIDHTGACLLGDINPTLQSLTQVPAYLSARAPKSSG